MKGLYKFIFLVFSVCGLQAQKSFHMGAVVLDYNSGIEFYNTTNVYTMIRPGFISDTTINTQTGNYNMSLGLELGIGRFVGIGVRGKTSSFFRSLDAVMNSRADIRANDLMLALNLHPLPLKRFDLVLGAEAGLSNLKFDVNDLAQTMVTSRGSVFTIYLNPRFYLKRFGFNLRASLPVFDYKRMKQITEHTGNYIITQWKASGMGISLGAQFRFF